MIILIPAYEPDDTLIDLVQALRSADPDLGVVVVDDGSGPQYTGVFDHARRLGCVVIGYPGNLGKGSALKTGFAFIADQFAGHDVVCADSDGQHSVVDILKVANRVQISTAAIVLGIREFSGEVPARSKFGNSMTRWLFTLATGRRIHDTQTGLRGYPSSMLGWLQSVHGDRYEYELNVLLLASREAIPIDTVPISTIYLAENKSSHFRPLADSIRIYAPLLKFLLSSLTAFVIDAVALLIFSALGGSLLVSVVGARVVSSAVNFTVNRNVVFSRGRDRPAIVEAGRYFALVVVLLALNFGLLSGLTAIGVGLLPAKLLTEILLVTVSFTVQRLFIFAGRHRHPAVAATPETAPELVGQHSAVS